MHRRNVALPLPLRPVLELLEDRVLLSSGPLVNGPTASDVTFTVAAGSENNKIAVVADGCGSDGSSVKLAAVGTAWHGKATVVGDDVLYTPAPGYLGQDGFTYSVTDASGEPASATLNINVELAGDINGDGIVNYADYNIWAANVGRIGATWAQGDLNGDGLVDVADYSIWAANTGKTAPAPIVPSGSTYTDLVGTPPNPATTAFGTWANNLLTARQREIATPTATYYFSAAGNDATGDGTEANPWQSIAQANTMLKTDGVRCLFRDGDEWPTSVGLVLAGNNTSAGSYSDGTAGHDASAPQPLIDCFTHTISAGAGWTQAAGNDYTYQLQVGSPAVIPAWIRNTARRFDAYAWMGTSAATTSGAGQAAAIGTAIASVAATPYSWFYDPTTGLLHVNCTPAGASAPVNPDAITWEWSDQSAIAHDGALIEQSGYVFGLRFDGWGCGPALGSQCNEYWGIVAAGGAGTSAVADDCQAYYDGMHNIGSDGAGGGAFSVINCVAGYTDDTDGVGTSTYVGFSVGGANETILWNCQCRFGELPWSGGPLSGWTDASVFANHCISGTIGLSLLWDVGTTGETSWNNATWGCGWIGFNNDNLPGIAGDITSLRAWAVGSDYSVPSSPGCGNQGDCSKGVLINARQETTLSAGSSQVIYDQLFGYDINETVDVLDPDGGANGYRTFAYGTAGNPAVTVNQTIRITCVNPLTIVNNWSGGGTVVNSVLCVVGGAAASNVNVPTSNSSHNAYSGLTDSRTGTEPGEISLSAPVVPGAIPAAASPLAGAGADLTTLLGAPLEYDAFWRPRDLIAPTIGSLECME